MKFFCHYPFPLALGLWLAVNHQLANAQLEEIFVSAQKRDENVQQVPIAISAFDADMLKTLQIDSFSDLRFNVPSTTFTKGNFTGVNFQIRGVGNTLVAASADSGVAAHVNDAPILFPLLYETEYYDIEQLVVLRGPQGTLYGRNATGGVVNMVTRKPEQEFGGDIELQMGDYDYRDVNGAVNLPLTDNLAIRLAGIFLERDGYTENLLPNGPDLDGRDQSSLRGSLRFSPTERDTLDVMVSWFDEDSTRSRSQKALCHNDPSALLGCLPDKLDNGVPNPSSQISNMLASTGILGPFGLFPFLENNNSRYPADLRKAAVEYEPHYQAEETLVTLQFEHEFDQYVATLVGSYQDVSVQSRQSYLWGEGRKVVVPDLVRVVLPETWNAYYANGLIPTSTDSENGTGSIGGHIAFYSDELSANDYSRQDTDQTSLELRFASNYDGDFNFLVGGFYMEANNDNDYYVFANGLDYVSAVSPVSEGLDAFAWIAPYFNSDTDFYGLDSMAVFGEIYYQLTDSLKLTVGARYTVDEKEIRDRQLLLNTDAQDNRIYVPLGQDNPIPVPYRNGDSQWEEGSGRVVLDWTPEVAATDSTLLYASYSRGYKGGGFNPPFDPVLYPNSETTFDPEFVDAFEAGTKNLLLNNRLQANLTAFYYDYKGLQVSKIVNRTAFNENTDADIFGVEGEFIFTPTETWVFNAMFSWNKSEIQDFQSVDPRDPSQGRSDVTLIKDFPYANNCVIENNGGPDPLAAGVIDSQFQDCAALAQLFDDPDFAYPYTMTDGVPVNLDGNQLQNSPQWTVGMGAQYNWLFGNAMRLETRLDYYWQDEMWGRNFNRDPIDKIESWDVWNGQTTLHSADESWTVTAWIQNIEDEDNVTGLFVSDATSGLFTNVFTIAPRTYGLSVGYHF